jgi:3-oxoacyl-[acyl-carrier protein] reductase
MKHRKVALVFGGSRGIGAAIVTALARDGHDVAFTYVSREDSARALAAALEQHGGRVAAIRADSADPAAIQAAVDETVRQFGVLDTVVVNAGILRLNRIEDYRLEDLDATLGVNVRGVFLAIQAAVAQMEDGGRVITIGSNTAVRTGHAGSSVYAMSKAAVAAMVQNLALDLAPRRITINNIQPGPIATDMTRDHADAVRQHIPLDRLGLPAEVASLALWLAGDSSGYMTGSSLTIDGGFVL